MGRAGGRPGVLTLCAAFGPNASFPKERKLHCLDRLTWSEHFESFLKTKYAAAKRFGLEGAETLIPGMKAMIDHAADLGVDSVVVGMPHRGRLNILGNVFRKVRLLAADRPARRRGGLLTRGAPAPYPAAARPHL